MTIAWYDPTNHHVSTNKNDPMFTPLGQLWPLIVQRTWVGLTKENMPDGENPMFDHEYFIAGMVFAAKILEEKNT